MKESFFSLPEEKRMAIINAGYRVFSQNSYKHSPMSEIAAAAGIIKSLLFHYFRSKKELYMFLWDTCARTTIEYLEKYHCYESTDLFESMERGMMAKFEIFHRYPDVASFAIKAFYEKDPEISKAVQESYRKYFDLKGEKTKMQIYPEMFRTGIDLKMMYREMYYASEGYLWEMVQQGNIDVEKMETDFRELMDFWKSIYLKEGDTDGGN